MSDQRPSLTLTDERLIEDGRRPGIELLHLQGSPGYEGERLFVSNSLSNGLRIEVENEDLDGIACFQINSPATALLIAARLTEWCERIADPPKGA